MPFFSFLADVDEISFDPDEIITDIETVSYFDAQVLGGQLQYTMVFPD